MGNNGLSHIGHNGDDHAVMSMQEAWANGYPGPPLPDHNEEGSLVECWRILRNRKLALLACGLVGLGLGILFTRAQAPVYQARASIQIDDVNASLPSISRHSQEAQPDLVISDLQTQIKLLESNTLTDRTIEHVKSDAARTGAAIQTRQSPLAQWLKISMLKPDDSEYLQLRSVADSVNIRSAGISRILEIRADSTDPQLAANFANALVDEYIKQNVDDRMKLSQRNNGWLEQQLGDMRQKLAASEQAMQSYAREQGLLFTGGMRANDQSRTNVSEEKLREVQQSLSTATADRVLKEARYRVASASPPDALADVLNDANLRDLRTKITDLRRQYDSLNAVYTPELANVKRAKEQLQTVETAFEHDRKEVLDRIKNDFDEAKLREGMLLNEYQDQVHTVTQDSEKTIQYQMLAHDVDSNRQVYDSMLQRIKESHIDAALKASNVQKVDAAIAPKIPYRPRTKLDAVVGLLLGCVFGAGLVIMIDRNDRSVRSPGQLVSRVSVPELGAIPRGAGRDSLLARAGYGLNGDSPAIAESFRVVMTSMLISSQNGGGGRTLVCTSTNAAEGKTTIAANLGVALSSIGKRVLLIDADLSQPSLHHVFELSNEKGLTALFRDGALTAENIREHLQETSQGVWVLTAGPRASNAANLLFSNEMADLLARLACQFDMVLIDTPPTPQMPHARILGKMADGVILVVRAGKTTPEAVSAALQRFAVDRIPVVGTVLNDWNPKQSPSYYYSTKARSNGRNKPHAFGTATGFDS